MFDKADYWLEIADNDIPAAKLLLDDGRYLHAGFFCHLITEKALKAVIADTTTKIPPKIHNLIKLAEIGGIYDELTEQQLSLLEELNPFHIEGRYFEYKSEIANTLTTERTTRIFEETEDFLCWIKQKLEK